VEDRPLRFAVLGCGFWSQFQIAAWREVGGVELVALYNRTRSRAEEMARRFAVPAVYDDAGELLHREELDFVDIITDVNTHARFVEQVAVRGLPVICQKPLAPDPATAQRMVHTCQQAGVPLAVHENWRWQTPIRALKESLTAHELGSPFRARVTFSNSFPVFANQPFLMELERFILTDIGSHILDTARFLFGEATELYCQTRRINEKIRGEDVATVMLRMGGGCTVVCEMSYASRMEHDRFPETYVQVECERGSVELGPDFRLSVTTEEGTRSRRCVPPHYAWADPAYDLVHASIVGCNADLLCSLRTGRQAETAAADNLRTVGLVFGAYESAASGQVVKLS